MKKILIPVLFIISLSNLFAQNNSFLESIKKQLIKKDNIINLRFPVNTVDGKWTFSEKPNWFAGFTAGELWYMFELTGDEQFKKRALAHCDNLIKFAELDNTHDLGFIFLNSCVLAYKHTGEIKYKEAAVKAAVMLAKRFNSKGNFIRAWGKLGTNDRDGLLIIDTMMNLELLFWAAEETGNYELKDIAWKHAITCMLQSARNDKSTYHVVEFDANTGKVLKKKTHQGISDESTWARGQAWGIYGFTNAYRRTGDKRFLKTAENLASYFLNKLPADNVPYFDLDLKNDTVPKDASASAIAASGLFMLANVIDDYSRSIKYKTAAADITNSLIENYLFIKSKRQTEEGILLHTTYNYPKGWGVDESYPAGDFYFIEAIYKLQKLNDEAIANKKGKISLNNDWGYLEENIKNHSELHSASKEWIKVNLPHTWNKYDALDNIPGYRRDGGWYKKTMNITPSKEKSYLLSFEGVNNKCDVYINGKYAGSHKGAFVGFEFDITGFLKSGDNEILVKADNSYDISIPPSQKSDFVIYGGITRNVWLKIYEKVFIEKVLISTPEVKKEQATTAADIKIINNTVNSVKAKIIAEITDNKNKVVAKEELKEILKPGLNNFNIKFNKVKNPLLWSPSAPNLYTMKITPVCEEQKSELFTEKFGYRFFEFRDSGAFYLNGERLLLRGTHRHEEFSGMGNALPDSLHRADMIAIKEMGANFVRLAHYPQAPEIYRTADEIGLILWDENPWCRGGVGDGEWKENTKRIFSEMIIQNYNHPSIIMWSIGNESDWLPDYPDGDNQDSLKSFAIELHKLAKTLDPGRLTTTRKFPQAAATVDVFSPSIWSGWYSDVYKNYEKALNRARSSFKKFFHAEYGGDSHVGRHVENPISGEGTISGDGEEAVNKLKVKNIANDGDWSESYMVDLFDWYLHVTENLDWFSGSAQWIFRDFTTPLRPENPIPYVNQKGLVDMAGNPKDAYYVFKSYWTENPKFCYIESHTWLDRQGSANQKRRVKVFSNCKEAELFVNGISQGKLKRDTKIFPASGLNWMVNFKEGNNELKVIGYEGDKKVAEDLIVVNYTTKNEKAEDIKLTGKRLPNGNYLITALAVDANGKRCVDFNRRIYFTALEGGRLIENMGTPSRSSVLEMASGKAEIEFEHIPLQKGVVEARTQDFKGSYIIID